MKKLEKIQQNKLISSYGGVGSIIETNSNGSLMIKPYNEWPCFSDGRWMQCVEIIDPRLLQYVKAYGYRHLDRLISIPTPDFEDRIRTYSPTNDDKQKTVGAKYFPEWYFCGNCRRLKKLSDWRTSWNLDDRFNDNEPACYVCSTRNGDRIHRHKLQQVRFVMVDMTTGELRDIPFDKLWENLPENQEWRLSERPINTELKYKNSKNNDGLYGIYIEATNIDGANRIIRMSQIYANYLIIPGNDDPLVNTPPSAYKTMLKGSQSLYLPNIVRSLYIPFNVETDQAALIQDELDIQEFRYLTNDNHYINDRLVERNLDLVAERKVLPNLPRYIYRITAVERLKETSVLLSYSRMARESEQRIWYDVENESVRNDMRPGCKKPFADRVLHDLTWMPAVESFGEGVLFELNLENIPQNERTVFAHSYCHIVMKEMEFQCGYPLTSLKEKIFIDDETAGFLIYTIAGSEGSFGGLISLTDDGRIIRLIERGAERAKHCTNDPICINEGDAHCFACLDLPETSCSRFNKDLNRRVFLERYFPEDQYLLDEEIENPINENTNDIDPETGITRGIDLI